MKMSVFQPLLLKAAVNLIACDGSIDDIELQELRNIADNEIFFSEFSYEDLLQEFVQDVRTRGKASLNSFLSELESSDIKERQKFILLEVLIRIMEADNKIETNELKFIQLVKNKLNLGEEAIIMQFPDKLEFLLENENDKIHSEFTDDIKFEETN